jgi:multiple sugar transport system substrate-binding protein
MRKYRTLWRLLAILFAFALVASACGDDDASDDEVEAVEETTDEAEEAAEETTEDTAAEDEGDDEAMAEGDATTLSMWYHGAGNDVEAALIQQIIDDFNASQTEYFVTREDFPQEAYNESIVAAALDGSLPDIIDVDGPVMPNWAWAGYMQPLSVDPAAYAEFLPGTIGEWNGDVYSVGLWDAAVAVMARKSVLDANGIRVPTLDEPWTLEEFDGALETLQATGEFDFAFDPGMAWTGEWYPYAFSPLLQSFGGDIIDRSSFQTAEGVLNGPEAVETGVIDGRYALQWNGNWAGVATLDGVEDPDDILFLPAPDFGSGSTIGAASWQFGVSGTSEHPDGANAFIEFALQDEYLAAFSDGIGLIPATPAAAALSENYSEGGALEVFFELSEAQALIRPPTPAYLNAAVVFEKALADIANGADVQDSLDAAVDAIDADIEANGGYAG